MLLTARGIPFGNTCRPQLGDCSATIAETLLERGAMEDLLNLAMLICTSVGSLAFGILAAYGILRMGFALMRPQADSAPVKAQPEAARVQ